MEELANIHDSLNSEIQFVEFEMKRARKKKGEEQKKILTSITKKLNYMQSNLTVYEMQLASSSASAKLKYQPLYEEVIEKKRGLDMDLKEMRDKANKADFINDKVQAPELFSSYKPADQKDIADMDQQEMIQHGDKKMNDASNRVDNMLNDLTNARDLNNDIAEVLYM